jgi:hypothetical protein
VYSARHGALAKQGISKSLERHYKSNRDKRAGNDFHKARASRRSRRHTHNLFFRIKGWGKTTPLKALLCVKRGESRYLTTYGISV